ncbi:hypothetical protein [Pedobacter montanisoli]|uniref:DUF4890 domain-containing protein n=1 Tax=Pedobacter montanisoli TaxID=2923277 RepID=A0ABS9ZXX8_9SPHI|nr:hypothetical protein [Pedobacter montanisoli]MCJ0743186.1 hypothetical protein [Pedobacter montanisoli]
MKKVFYLFAITILFITSSYAQQQKYNRATPEEKADRYAARLQEKLSLSNEQKDKIKQIELKALNENVKRRKQDTENRKKYINERQAKIEAVLTAEQLKNFKALKKEHHPAQKKERNKKAPLKQEM